MRQFFLLFHLIINMSDSSSSDHNPEDFEYNEDYEGEYEMESS